MGANWNLSKWVCDLDVEACIEAIDNVNFKRKEERRVSNSPGQCGGGHL